MEEESIEKVRFIDFLTRKNINAEALLVSEPEIYQKWQHLFEKVSEASFVLQQKFYLNPMRRKYPKLNHQNT